MSENPTMVLCCATCSKQLSHNMPLGTTVRAKMLCPECADKLDLPIPETSKETAPKGLQTKSAETAQKSISSPRRVQTGPIPPTALTVRTVNLEVAYGRLAPRVTAAIVHLEHNDIKGVQRSLEEARTVLDSVDALYLEGINVEEKT